MAETTHVLRPKRPTPNIGRNDPAETTQGRNDPGSGKSIKKWSLQINSLHNVGPLQTFGWIPATCQFHGSENQSPATCTMAKIIAFLVVSLFSLAICNGEQMCHSVPGGQVYPQETCGPQEGQRSIGHTIQWSQAISKWDRIRTMQVRTKSELPIYSRFTVQLFIDNMQACHNVSVEKPEMF